MLQLTIYNADQHEQIAIPPAAALEVGVAPLGEHVAKVRDDRVADRQLILEEIEQAGATFARVTNLGRILVLEGGQRILAGGSRDLELPVQIWVGRSLLLITAQDSPRDIDVALTQLPTLEDDPLEFSASMAKIGQAPSSNTLAFWFDALGRLQRRVAGSVEFFRDAAYALFDPCGLDAGFVLLLEDGHWRSAGSFVANPGLGIVYRDTILQALVERRRTLFHDARALEMLEIDRSVPFAVAAPILDENGSVRGAVYGARFDHPKNNRRGIRPLEAQFVQAVADTVSAALIRQQRETEAAHARARFEQFFSPKLARELERDPKMLDGTQREVTVMFCDLRGFTALSNTLSSKQTYRLLGDILDRFTARVLEFDGVVIDYYGDGLCCFWNAPLDQRDHAILACRAALGMLQDLPEISTDWLGVIDKHLRMGIGIHTGTALVGNAGSRRRLKYGPRGTTVNIASRVEAATKQLGLPLLITRATQERLGTEIGSRFVQAASLPGIEGLVDLFEPLRDGITVTSDGAHAQIVT